MLNFKLFKTKNFKTTQEVGKHEKRSFDSDTDTEIGTWHLVPIPKLGLVADLPLAHIPQPEIFRSSYGSVKNQTLGAKIHALKNSVTLTWVNRHCGKTF